MIVIPEWGEGHEDRLLAVGSFVWVALDCTPTLSHLCVLPEMQGSQRYLTADSTTGAALTDRLKVLRGLERQKDNYSQTA